MRVDITDKILRVVKDFDLTIVDTGPDFVLLQSVNSQEGNDNIVSKLQLLKCKTEIVRVEALPLIKKSSLICVNVVKTDEEEEFKKVSEC